MTWSKIHQGLWDHDIAHYAIEKILSLKNSFFGMIDQGLDLAYSADKKKQAAHPFLKSLPPEAIVTEHLVYLLQIKRRHRNDPTLLIPTLKEILISKQLPFPKGLDKKTLFLIRKEFIDNSKQIANLSIDGKLTLLF